MCHRNHVISVTVLRRERLPRFSSMLTFCARLEPVASRLLRHAAGRHQPRRHSCHTKRHNGYADVQWSEARHTLNLLNARNQARTS
jgi:hypothetical protein